MSERSADVKLSRDKLIIGIVGLALSGGAWLGRGIWDAAASKTDVDNAITQMGGTLQRQSTEIEQLEIEVEWLVRHNADAKDAPIPYNESNPKHSMMIQPSLDQAQNTSQDAALPPEEVHEHAGR